MLTKRPLPILPDNILNPTQQEHPTIIPILLLWEVLIQHHYRFIQPIYHLGEFLDIGESRAKCVTGLIPLEFLPDAVVNDDLLVDDLYE